MERLVRSAEARPEDPLILYGSRVVFRSGNPINEYDLTQVSAAYARCIIVLSGGNIAPDDADSRTVRQILALQQIKASAGGSLRGHIVAEVQDVDNLAMARMVGKADLEAVVTHELIGRLMLRAARSPGVAPVLSALLGFEGAELYVRFWPELVGQAFGSACRRFDAAIGVGVRRARDGVVLLNPPDDMLLTDGDQMLVIAEDNSTYHLRDPPKDGDDDDALLQGRAVAADNPPPERLLFCGWRRDMADLIRELDEEAPEGSELWLFNGVPMRDREEKLLDRGNKPPLRLRNLRLRHVVGNPTSRRQLLHLHEVSDGKDRVGVPLGAPTGAAAVLSQFTAILILSDSAAGADGGRDVEASDSRALAATLGIQDIQQASMLRMEALGRKVQLYPPISEILDMRTARQMQLVSPGYVMSNHLVASYLAMVAEDRVVNGIYGEQLLSCRGSEIQVRKLADYVRVSPGELLSFWQLFRIARSQSDLLIGFIPHPAPDAAPRLQRGISFRTASVATSAGAGGPYGGVVLNPEDKDSLRKWQPEDRLILIGTSRRARLKSDMRRLRIAGEAELLRRWAAEDQAAAEATQYPTANGPAVANGNVGGCETAMPEAALGRSGLEMHGWLKKLCLDTPRGLDLDDERSWRDRLAFVAGGALRYVSEKKSGTSETVCRLRDLRGVQVSDGWPPSLFVFKIDFLPPPPGYDPDKPTSGDAEADVEPPPHCALQSRIFAAASLDECTTWVQVLTRGAARSHGGRVLQPKIIYL